MLVQIDPHASSTLDSQNQQTKSYLKVLPSAPKCYMARKQSIKGHHSLKDSTWLS